MLTYLLLFFLPGVVVSGGAAVAWRRLTGGSKPHWLLASTLATLILIGGWSFGLWLFLDVLGGGVVGDVAGVGLLWSAISAIAGFLVFRRFDVRREA